MNKTYNIYEVSVNPFANNAQMSLNTFKADPLFICTLTKLIIGLMSQ